MQRYFFKVAIMPASHNLTTNKQTDAARAFRHHNWRDFLMQAGGSGKLFQELAHGKPS